MKWCSIIVDVTGCFFFNNLCNNLDILQRGKSKDAEEKISSHFAAKTPTFWVHAFTQARFTQTNKHFKTLTPKKEIKTAD